MVWTVTACKNCYLAPFRYTLVLYNWKTARFSIFLKNSLEILTIIYLEMYFQECGMDIKKEMSQNILLVGGCTMIPGFGDRLQMELTKLCPPHLKPKVSVRNFLPYSFYLPATFRNILFIF